MDDNRETKGDNRRNIVYKEKLNIKTKRLGAHISHVEDNSEAAQDVFLISVDVVSRRSAKVAIREDEQEEPVNDVIIPNLIKERSPHRPAQAQEGD